LLLSIAITVLSTLIGTLLGLFSAIASLSSYKAARTTANAYVETFRNTPLLVQMYLIYFGLGQFGVQIHPIAAAIIAMTLNTGAYTTVIFQAGIQAVDVGQKEGGLVLGMTPQRSGCDPAPGLPDRLCTPGEPGDKPLLVFGRCINHYCP
jgi:His/Glu/Gln/Arg/opine family amino acid ABC transporter permease subunit